MTDKFPGYSISSLLAIAACFFALALLAACFPSVEALEAGAPIPPEEFGDDYYKAMCCGANYAWANRQMDTSPVRFRTKARMYFPHTCYVHKNSLFLFSLSQSIYSILLVRPFVRSCADAFHKQ